MSKLAEDYTNTQYKASTEPLIAFAQKIASGVSELDDEVRTLGKFAVRSVVISHHETTLQYNLFQASRPRFALTA